MPRRAAACTRRSPVVDSTRDASRDGAAPVLADRLRTSASLRPARAVAVVCCRRRSAPWREAALPGRPVTARRPAGGGSAAERARAASRRRSSGSSEAFAELFRRHWPRAHRAAWLVVHDAAAAEDVAQEAFLSAIRALHRFDRRRPFAPWLHRIVVNRAIDYARMREARREVGAEAAGELAAALGEDVAAAPSADVLAALARVDPEQRAVIVLRHLLEFTPGEIATALGLPRGTVNSRLRRGLDGLQDELGGRRR